MRRTTVTASVAAVTLIAAGLAMAGCSAVATKDVVSYQVTGDVNHLDVSDPVGSVRVSPGDGPVRVTETIRYTADEPQTTHETDAGTLRLSGGNCSRHADVCLVDYRVEVPAVTSVRIIDAAGRVTISGMAGDLTISGTTGEVEASGLTSAHATVHNEAGPVSLRFSSAPVTVDITSTVGAIDVRVPSDETYAVDTDGNAGETTVTVPVDPNSSRRITAQNSVGKITIGT